MTILSVRQPWAHALVAGWKPGDNRSWRTTYRGTLGIHAGRRRDDAAAVDFVTRLHPELASVRLTYSGLIGTVTLVDVISTREAYEERRLRPWVKRDIEWFWLVGEPTMFSRAIPMSGQLRLFKASISLEAEMVSIASEGTGKIQ